jgi:hypothetical protein
MWKSSAPVVVGVDGSDAAISTAKWAIDKRSAATSRYESPTYAHSETARRAERRLPARRSSRRVVAMRAATAAVEATGKARQDRD